MAAKPSIDPAQFLHEQLATASPDLLREMLASFIGALMSAEAETLCGAEYGERSPDRVNVRNGYRHSDFDTMSSLISDGPTGRRCTLRPSRRRNRRRGHRGHRHLVQAARADPNGAAEGYRQVVQVHCAVRAVHRPGNIPIARYIVVPPCAPSRGRARVALLS
jgi:hypothetical protein